MKRIIVFLIFIPLLSCEKEIKQATSCLKQQQEFDSSIKLQKWKQLKCGLYKNKNGDLGFQSFKTICKEGAGKEFYIIKFSYTETNLKEIIDTTSFKRLEDNFFEDKNYKYTYNSMAYGGVFNIVDTLRSEK